MLGKPIALFVDEQSNQYFNLISRGGLTYSTNMLFKTIQYAYSCYLIHVACGHCGVVMKVIVMKVLSCFANTLLNNYSKDKCEDIITSKVSRKLAKFN